MNYSNLPVYIREEESSDPLSFADIYDPAGDDNSLYMINKSPTQNTSIQYFNNSFSRVSGNALNYEELIAPKINYTSPDVQIILPQFRSLVFYNLDGSRAENPLSPPDLLPPLYLYDYDTGDNTINYIHFFEGPYYIALGWSGSNDTYSLDLWNIEIPSGPVANIFSASGTGFSSGWRDSADVYAGVVCSGLGISASGILNTINNPTGYSLYYTENDSNTFIINAISGSALVADVLSVDTVNTATGYVSPHKKLTLGKAYHYIPAQNISVDYQAQNDALRVLGVDIDQSNQFTNGAALQAKVSFNSYVNTETSGALSTVLDSSGDNFYSIRFGNNIYSGCYLNNYDINVEPFKPIGLNASYIVNDAPVLNSNRNQYITVNIPASANYLLDSESLTGSNYIYTNLGTPIGNQADPTGGYKATLISGQDAIINYVDYYVNNSGSSYVSITGDGTPLTYLKSDQDLSTGIAFTGDKKFSMGDTTYSKVFISNNGIITFDSADEGYASYQNQPFPIPATTKKFLAAYWRDMFASGGTIFYRQDTTRFVIEYDRVNASRGSKPQTYQIILYFDSIVSPSSSQIHIRYKEVSPLSDFNPSADVGIQWGSDKYINYGLNKVDFTKILKFNRVSTGVLTKGNFIYKNKITPDQQRTFSIYLKRSVGNGDIRYTLNGGANWATIYPPLSEDWSRYSFPSTTASQQIGIEIQTSGDAIYVYGGQVDPLAYSTDYIPTSGVIGTRSASSFNVPVDAISPSIDLTTGFANTMINGNTCSISSTTGFVSNIQSSIRYSVNCGRSPVYNLGQTNASKFILDTVEKQMDVSSTDLASFINFSGSRLQSDLNLTLKNAQSIIGATISMKSGANIFSQQMNIQEGETLTTQVSIKEIIV
jgi:hypothetical protein